MDELTGYTVSEEGYLVPVFKIDSAAANQKKRVRLEDAPVLKPAPKPAPKPE